MWSSLPQRSSVQMGSVAKCHGPCQPRLCTDPAGVTVEVLTSPQARAWYPLQWLLSGSTSSNGSCGSASILQGPSPVSPTLMLTRVTDRRASFSRNPFLCLWPVLESQSTQSPQASSTCDLAEEATRKQPSNHPHKASLAQILSGHDQSPDFQGH